MNNPNKLPESSDWDFDLLVKIDKECARIAKNYGLDTYPNEIQVITSEQMIDAYSSVGLPTYYNHWSFGKSFIQEQRTYKRGESGLAYEIVINSSPCIAYLMEENSLMMQTLVIAHASYGHNSFFKNNYLFREWTDAEGIVDYMKFAKNYIKECEEKHGVAVVEKVLDACHSLQNFGVDKYKRPKKLSAAQEKEKQKDRENYAQSQINDLWSTVPKQGKNNKLENKEIFPKEPEENILYFIEKNAPHLETWKREIIRIVRKIAQYFYPQRQTQVMNEGWATFWHYTILNTMYDEDLVGDGFMLEFLKSHSSVTFQSSPSRNNPAPRINPYALGFAMFNDIKRMCENPTEEDTKWFPELVGKDWKVELDYAMRNFRDESFVLQYLSPKVIRDFRLFSIMDDSNNKYSYEVSAIHDDEGYRHIRKSLSQQYNLSANEPDIQVWSVNIKGDRTLTLRHNQQNGRDLNDYTYEVLRHVKHLWGHGVYLTTVTPRGEIVDLKSSI